MDSPKLSFVVTTKNRAHLVGGAIDSLLRQTESNFEIVVVNNDETEETTSVLNQYHDLRIRHIRTGGLGMPQNWRRGLDEARGEWVIFVEEKYRIKRNALEVISHYINSNPCEVYTWLTVPDWKDAAGPDFYVTYSKAEECNSHQYLLDVSNGLTEKYFDIIPKLLNCAVSKSVINKVNAINPEVLCSPISCDLTSGYAILASVDKFIFLNCSLSMIPPNSPSQGEASYKRTPGYQKFIYDAGLTLEDTYNNVPVKYLSLQNSLFNDFATIMGKLSKSDSFPINLPYYYSKLAEEARNYMMNGTPFNDESNILQKAFSTESLGIRLDTLYKDLKKTLNKFNFRNRSHWCNLTTCIKRNLLLWGF